MPHDLLLIHAWCAVLLDSYFGSFHTFRYEFFMSDPLDQKGAKYLFWMRYFRTKRYLGRTFCEAEGPRALIGPLDALSDCCAGPLIGSDYLRTFAPAKWAPQSRRHNLVSEHQEEAIAGKMLYNYGEKSDIAAGVPKAVRTVSAMNLKR